MVRADIPNAVQDYYNKYWADEGFNPDFTNPNEYAALFAKHIPGGSRCLDLGCGGGTTSGIWLSSHGYDYQGVDIAETAVEKARMRGLSADVINDAASLPFEDGSFNAVVCIEVLEHLLLPQLALREALRVLTPGGVLIATVPNVAYWRRRFELAVHGLFNPYGDDLSLRQPWRDPHIRFFNMKNFHDVLDECGFNQIRIGGHHGTLSRLIGKAGFVNHRMDGDPGFKRAAAGTTSLLGLRLHAIARKPATQ